MSSIPKRPARAFIIGAYIPNGGTYMAYHLGRILHLDFAIEALAVRVGSETADHGIHQYEPRFASVSIPEMEAQVTEEDLIVCNPSFSSYMFGLRLPCRKISYVQHFNTFRLLDRRFDHYVSASTVVSRFLHSIYGITTRVITPFISAEKFPDPTPWRSRPEGSTIAFLKGERSVIDPFMNRLRSILNCSTPEIKLENSFSGLSIPQPELMRRIGENRHFLALSPAEGFGLLPLEAMAMGTTVLGFDGFGGLDYMRPGINCTVSPYADIESVAQSLIELNRSPEYAFKLAEAGRATAAWHNYTKFRRAWIEEFSLFLDMPAINDGAHEDSRSAIG